MNVSLRQLKAFLAVARHTSFTKAAEQMHLTQAGLSAMVRELESQAGCRLFERTTRSVVLTPAGERLVPAAQRALDELAGALSDAQAVHELAQRRLRVGVTPLMASSVMPSVLRAFAQTHPEVRVDVTDVDRSLIRQRVEAGDLDIGLGAFFNRESGIRRQAIMPAHLVLAMPRDGAAPKRVRWADIAVHTLISLNAHNEIQRLVDRHLNVSEELARGRRVVTYLETMLAMVAGGLGQAVVPSFAALAADRWPLHFVPLWPVVAFDYFSIARAGGARSPLADAFVESFVAVAGERQRCMDERAIDTAQG